jgi:uncharacterized protein Yka (UPF0111/DUF47 family)
MRSLRLFPEQTDFFAYFRDAAATAAEASRLLSALFAGQASPEEGERRLRELEHRGDDITHEVFAALARNLIAPISHEDIRALTRQLDDFIDRITEVGQRLVLYRLLPATEPAQHLAQIIQAQAEIVAASAPLVADGKHREALGRHVAELHRLEHEADEALHQVLAGLYKGVAEIPAFVHARRWGELYEMLEDTTDCAEQIASTLEGIMEQRP